MSKEAAIEMIRELDSYGLITVTSSDEALTEALEELAICDRE